MVGTNDRRVTQKSGKRPASSFRSGRRPLISISFTIFFGCILTLQSLHQDEGHLVTWHDRLSRGFIPAASLAGNVGRLAANLLAMTGTVMPLMTPNHVPNAVPLGPGCPTPSRSSQRHCPGRSRSEKHRAGRRAKASAQSLRNREIHDGREWNGSPKTPGNGLGISRTTLFDNPQVF